MNVEITNIRNHFENGDIVYFVHKDIDSKYRVRFGVVYDEFSDGVCIDYLELKDTRKIDGIPIRDFKFPTKWQKLPKGWTWNTELFKLTWEGDESDKEFRNLKVDNIEDIKYAYSKGYLIKSADYDHCTIESEITKEGWRIVKKYNPYSHKPVSTTLPYYNVYNNYKDACDKATELNNEILRQCSLSDLEWSIEQIDKTINHYRKLTNNDTYCDNVREYLMKFDKLEDLEIRIFDNIIQWKYWKNKKWNTIDNNTFM